MVALRRRDEALERLASEVKGHRDTIESLDNEAVAIRKTIKAEQERNERLTAILNKVCRLCVCVCVLCACACFEYGGGIVGCNFEGVYHLTPFPLLATCPAMPPPLSSPLPMFR